MKSQSTWKCSYLSRKARFLEVVVCSLTVCLLAPICAFGAFGLTDSNGYYTVDTGGGLVFTVTKANGDVISLKYNNVEYQEPTKGSQVNSGFGTATVTATTYGNSYIKITVVDSTGTLTHYYMARNGYNNIYMATYFTQEPSLGLVRYIVRIPSSLLPNGPNPSDIRNNTGAIEVSDIFGMSDGTTRSKHYSNHWLIDWSYTGATGHNVGVFMVRSNHEGDSGGPFIDVSSTNVVPIRKFMKSSITAKHKRKRFVPAFSTDHTRWFLSMVLNRLYHWIPPGSRTWTCSDMSRNGIVIM